MVNRYKKKPSELLRILGRKYKNRKCGMFSEKK
jgi:hypothetical protein